MIFEGSRYEHATVVQVMDSTGVTRPAIYQRPGFDEQFFLFDQYTFNEGDRLDVLAYSYYGDPLLWWIIARANPELFYPDDYPPGSVIRVPHANSLR